PAAHHGGGPQLITAAACSASRRRRQPALVDVGVTAARRREHQVTEVLREGGGALVAFGLGGQRLRLCEGLVERAAPRPEDLSQLEPRGVERDEPSVLTQVRVEIVALAVYLRERARQRGLGGLGLDQELVDAVERRPR